MKIPNPVNGLNKNQTNKHASVNEIHTDTIRLKSGEFGGEETSTQVTLKAPAQTLSKHASRESLAICNTTSHKSSMPNEQKSYNSKRDLAKTENNSSMTTAKQLTTTTDGLSDKKQQCTKAIVSTYFDIESITKTVIFEVKMYRYNYVLI